jgi:uncharacterized membrane protein YqjE
VAVEAQREGPGLLASLRRLGSSFVATLHSRAELLTLELERERIRVTRLAVLGVAALFFLALGALTATTFIIVAFWDTQRLVVIGFLTVLYLGIGMGIAVFVKREADRSTRPFSSSVAQLQKDRDKLSGV